MEIVGNCSITRLQIENIKRISVFEMVLDKNGVYIIGGRNAQGKTTALDSFSMIVGGTKLCPDEPIKKGEREGFSEADIVDETGKIVAIARRKFKLGKGGRLTSSLIIKNPKGAIQTAPQAIMSVLTDVVSFDPLQFKALDPKKQLAVLRDIVGLDFTQLDEERAVLYVNRTDINRQIKDKEGYVGGLPNYPADTPDKEIVVDDLMAELEKVQQHNADITDMSAKLGDMRYNLSEDEKSLSVLTGQFEEIENTIRLAKADIHKRKGLIDAAQSAYSKIQPQDEEPIREKISNSQAISTNVRNKQAEQAGLAELEELEASVEVFTDCIEKIDAEKERQIATAPFPIEGLAFTPDGVTYNNILFAQCSQAEQLRISVAMGMALNPKLRVMTIRDGSLLDDENMQLIDDMAKDKEFKILMEVVGNPEDAAVIIEDGMILESEE